MKLNVTQAQTLAKAGYVPVADAAHLAGNAVSTLYKLATAGRIKTTRAGKRWYVDIASLVDYHRKEKNLPTYVQELEKKLKARLVELREARV